VLFNLGFRLLPLFLFPFLADLHRCFPSFPRLPFFTHSLRFGFSSSLFRIRLREGFIEELQPFFLPEMTLYVDYTPMLNLFLVKSHPLFSLLIRPFQRVLWPGSPLVSIENSLVFFPLVGKVTWTAGLCFFFF